MPKPKPYPEAQESEQKPSSKGPKRKGPKRARKRSKKRLQKRSKPPKARSAPRKEKALARKPARRKAPPKARVTVRRNPAAAAVDIEAAFYQLGYLTAFEFERGGRVEKFCFDRDHAPVLAADEEGALRLVYDPRVLRAGVPAAVEALHETFNGFAPSKSLRGIFAKKVPGTARMGALRALTYYSEKCVDAESCASPGFYRHAFKAPYPQMLVSPTGLLLIEGGAYEITRAGIVR